MREPRMERGGLDYGALGAGCWHDQSLLHCWYVSSSQLGFDFVELVRLLGLVIGLDEQFHREGVVLIFFKMGDRILVLLLIHQQRSRGSLVGALNNPVTAAVGHAFELLERFLGHRFVACTECMDDTIAQD